MLDYENAVKTIVGDKIKVMPLYWRGEYPLNV